MQIKHDPEDMDCIKASLVLLSWIFFKSYALNTFSIISLDSSKSSCSSEDSSLEEFASASEDWTFSRCFFKFA